MASYEIWIANDNDEAEEFQGWLIGKGYNAKVGQSTHNFVNGEDCSANHKAANRRD